jgi:hypothetical protein
VRRLACQLHVLASALVIAALGQGGLVQGGRVHAQEGHVAPRLEIARWQVETDCVSRDDFAARVESAGGVFDGFVVELEVTRAWSGLFSGRLALARVGEPFESRELEDATCVDVVDALAITAALRLRTLASLPQREASPQSHGPDEISLTLHERGSTTAEAPRPTGPRLEVGLGAHGRVGLGPVPGLAGALSLTVDIDVERVAIAVHLAHWPDATATASGSMRGVALQALSATVELGYRAGDQPGPSPAFGATPALVLEPVLTLARGLGVDAPRTEVVGAFDLGMSLTAHVDVGPLRLFARGDLLFATIATSFGIQGEIAYESPVVRGTGALGALVFLGRD